MNHAPSRRADMLASDAAIRSLLAEQDHRRAATLILRSYGAELLRFLHVRLRSSSDADEAFSMVCEDMWSGLPGFRGAASVRTWLFVLARSVASRVYIARKQTLQRRSFVELELHDVIDHVRTTTAMFRKTSSKLLLRGLREKLDDDQQTLMILRVDRGLSWKELAVVMHEALPDSEGEELERASARVRTRFQVAKKRLRELVEEAGVLRAGSDEGRATSSDP